MAVSSTKGIVGLPTEWINSYGQWPSKGYWEMHNSDGSVHYQNFRTQVIGSDTIWDVYRNVVL